jgi:hypothetical protein
MTGINSAVTGKLSDPPVIMTGITSRFISRPETKNGKKLSQKKIGPSFMDIFHIEGKI